MSLLRRCIRARRHTLVERTAVRVCEVVGYAEVSGSNCPVARRTSCFLLSDDHTSGSACDLDLIANAARQASSGDTSGQQIHLYIPNYRASRYPSYIIRDQASTRLVQITSKGPAAPRNAPGMSSERSADDSDFNDEDYSLQSIDMPFDTPPRGPFKTASPLKALFDPSPPAVAVKDGGEASANADNDGAPRLHQAWQCTACETLHFCEGGASYAPLSCGELMVTGQAWEDECEGTEFRLRAVKLTETGKRREVELWPMTQEVCMKDGEVVQVGQTASGEVSAMEGEKEERAAQHLEKRVSIPASDAATLLVKSPDGEHLDIDKKLHTRPSPRPASASFSKKRGRKPSRGLRRHSHAKVAYPRRASLVTAGDADTRPGNERCDSVLNLLHAAGGDGRGGGALGAADHARVQIGTLDHAVTKSEDSALAAMTSFIPSEHGDLATSFEKARMSVSPDVFQTFAGPTTSRATTASMKHGLVSRPKVADAFPAYGAGDEGPVVNDVDHMRVPGEDLLDSDTRIGGGAFSRFPHVAHDSNSGTDVCHDTDTYVRSSSSPPCAPAAHSDEFSTPELRNKRGAKKERIMNSVRRRRGQALSSPAKEQQSRGQDQHTPAQAGRRAQSPTKRQASAQVGPSSAKRTFGTVISHNAVSLPVPTSTRNTGARAKKSGKSHCKSNEWDSFIEAMLEEIENPANSAVPSPDPTCAAFSNIGEATPSARAVVSASAHAVRSLLEEMRTPKHNGVQWSSPAETTASTT
ncbi:hypothetical protein LTR53_005586, partial [Teratosphaeriaceae sp. CCFEE 6253]